MNLLLRYIFFGIVGSLKLIHLDLMYMNHMVQPEKYQKDAEETSKSINECISYVKRNCR